MQPTRRTTRVLAQTRAIRQKEARDTLSHGRLPVPTHTRRQLVVLEYVWYDPVHEVEPIIIYLDTESISETEPLQTPPAQPPAPRRSRRFFFLAACFICLSMLLSLSVMGIMLYVTPSATVTIIPRAQEIATTTTIPFAQINARSLPPLTLSQAQTVKATGTGHQDAQAAQGTITFYNGLFASQTVAAGTLLTGADGIQVVTDQVAIIPAGNPPTYGQVTVSAHALSAGSQGNIPAGDINQACCLASVLAQNTQRFTGGEDKRDFPIVTKQDIDRTAQTLQATITQSMQAALQPQITPQEALVTPLVCTPQRGADHHPGDEATEVTVTVSETCTARAYNQHELQTQATTVLSQEVSKRLGAGYTLVGDLTVTPLQEPVGGSNTSFSIRIQGTVLHQVSQDEQQRMMKLIAGTSKQQAIHTLLSLPGIRTVSVTGGDSLPQDPTRINLVVVYRD